MVDYTVHGKLTGVVIVFRGNDRNNYEEIKLKGVNKACFELINADHVFATGRNFEMKFEEMFDHGCDTWHASIEFDCDISLPIKAQTSKQALEFASMFYSKYFYKERVHLFTSINNAMIEYDIEGSVIHYDSVKELHKGAYAV